VEGGSACLKLTSNDFWTRNFQKKSHENYGSILFSPHPLCLAFLVTQGLRPGCKTRYIYQNIPFASRRISSLYKSLLIEFPQPAKWKGRYSAEKPIVLPRWKRGPQEQRPG
jgi:hypothetical protein